MGEDETEQRVRTVQELIRVKEGLPPSEDEAIERALKFYIDQHEVVKKSNETVTTPTLNPIDEDERDHFTLGSASESITEPFPEVQLDE